MFPRSRSSAGWLTQIAMIACSCCLYAPSASRLTGVPQLSLGQKAILRCTPDYVSLLSSLTRPLWPIISFPPDRLMALVASRPSFPPTRASLLRCSFSVSTDRPIASYRASICDTDVCLRISVFDQAVSQWWCSWGFFLRYCCPSFCPSYYLSLFHSRIPHPLPVYTSGADPRFCSMCHVLMDVLSRECRFLVP